MSALREKRMVVARQEFFQCETRILAASEVGVSALRTEGPLPIWAIPHMIGAAMTVRSFSDAATFAGLRVGRFSSTTVL